MVKIIFFIVCIISLFCDSSTLNNILCRYDVLGYNILSSIYRCEVKNDHIIFSQESVVIKSISGRHQSSKSDSDVIGIHSSGTTILYFPQGLESFFNNLKLIYFQSSGMKEIHQSDLKPLTNLVYLSLFNNDIEVLEEGLFDFNPNLEVVGFDRGKIIHIDPKVFDNLDKLSFFWLSKNPCIDKFVSNSRSEVQNAIKFAKSQCIDSDFKSFDEKLTNLENKSGTLSSNELAVKLKSLEESFQKSKLYKFRPLKNKLEALKTDTFIELTTQATTEPTISSTASSSECFNCCRIDEISTVNQNFQNSIITSFTSSLNSVESSIHTLESNLNTTIDAKFSLFDEKLENLDDRVATSNGQISRKLDAIQKEFDIVRYKTLVSIDAKLKLIENRMMENIEKILDGKLEEILKNLLKT
ncbi:hypothetical protein ACKWTF_016030 [Chironomus riparius]